MKRPPLICISLDGMGFKLLELGRKNGLLNCIDEIIQNGILKELKSVVPPISAAAWSTYQTGLSPLEQGVFDFIVLEKNMKLTLIDYDHLPRPTLVEALSRKGFFVCQLYLPCTSPPPSINGISCSGILSKIEDKLEIFPISLQQKIIKEVGEFVPIPRSRYRYSLGDQKFLKLLIDSIKYRFKSAMWCYKLKNWDYFHLHIHETDIFQHAFWEEIEESHKSNEVISFIKLFLKTLDSEISLFLENCSKKANKIFFSDHGFEKVTNIIYPNRILRVNNFLKLNKEEKMDRKSHNRRESFENIVFKLNEDIDKNRTSALCISAHRAILIKVFSKNPIATIKQVTALFQKNYSNAIEKIECLDSNKHLKGDLRLPDMIIHLKEGWFANLDILGENIFEELNGMNALVGGHHPSGLFFTDAKIWVEELSKIEDNLKFLDLTPSLFTYFNIHPGFCSGKSMLKLEILDSQNNAIIINRLKDLGYL